MEEAAQYAVATTVAAAPEHYNIPITSIFARIPPALHLAAKQMHRMQGAVNKVRVLDLNDVALTLLPKEIGHFKRLKELRANNNNLFTIEQHLFELTTLQLLSMSHNKIRSVPNNITMLVKLADLNLSYNRLERVAGSLFSMELLQTLNLRSNRLTSLPFEIVGMSMVQVLNLSRNLDLVFPPSELCSNKEGNRQGDMLFKYFRQVAAAEGSTDEAVDAGSAGLRSRSATALDLHGYELERLPINFLRTYGNLQHLNVSHNRFLVVPDAIDALSNLTTLELDHNKITTLPNGLSSLSALTLLNLESNCIESLPSVIAHCCNLSDLRLKGNPLQFPPTEVLRGSTKEIQQFMAYVEAAQAGGSVNFDGWGLRSYPLQFTQLTALSMNKNRLERLPSLCAHMLRLTELSLCHNQIQIIPTYICAIVALHTLSLASNRIAEIPSPIGALHCLTSLDLSGNWIVSMPDSLGDLSNLRWLSLARNMIDAVTPRIAMLAKLDLLDLDSNRIRRVPEIFDQLISLADVRLAHNALTECPATLSIANRHLTSIRLSFNAVNVVPLHVFEMVQLRRLEIAGCQLKRVPFELKEMSALTHLDLSHNRLRTCPAGVHYLTTLSELNLSHNAIDAMDSRFSLLTRLRLLHCAHNYLTNFGHSVFLALTALSSLDMSHNHIGYIAAPRLSLAPRDGLQQVDRLLLVGDLCVGAMPSLTHLAISNNVMQWLPIDLVFCKSLRSLECAMDSLVDPPKHVVEGGFESTLAYLRAVCLDQHRSVEWQRRIEVAMAVDDKQIKMSEALQHAHEYLMSVRVADRWEQLEMPFHVENSFPEVMEDAERDKRMLAQQIYMHEWAQHEKKLGLPLNTDRSGILADNINVDEEVLELLAPAWALSRPHSKTAPLDIGTAKPMSVLALNRYQRMALGILPAMQLKGKFARRNAMRTEEDYWGVRDALATAAAEMTELEKMLEDEEQLRDALLSFDSAYQQQTVVPPRS
jgi:Leucine-rich repeat (LRR) protein